MFLRVFSFYVSSSHPAYRITCFYVSRGHPAYRMTCFYASRSHLAYRITCFYVFRSHPAYRLTCFYVSSGHPAYSITCFYVSRNHPVLTCPETIRHIDSFVGDDHFAGLAKGFWSCLGILIYTSFSAQRSFQHIHRMVFPKNDFHIVQFPGLRMKNLRSLVYSLGFHDRSLQIRV